MGKKAGQREVYATAMSSTEAGLPAEIFKLWGT
jgi:hypothetical protein